MSLPKAEICLYFAIWSGGVITSLYHLHKVGQVFDHQHHDQYHYNDFARGWTILGNRFRDIADYEWNTWTELILKLLPWLLLNLLGAEILRKLEWFNLLPLWYAAVTISVVTYHFNIMITLTFIMQTYAFYICIFLKSRLLVWIFSFIILHCFKLEDWLNIKEDDKYLILTASSWMILRCISHTLDELNQSFVVQKTIKQHFLAGLMLFGYSFYLPTMFCGPFISFGQFYSGTRLSYQKWDSKRIQTVMFAFARCLFWFYFTLFSLHFVYVNAILLRPYLVRDLFDWELAGLGIAMGHFFHLKYVVFYGIPCAWAAAERYSTPDSPCCVSTVHLYSYMWKHFDHGLYQFLVRYIYIPIRFCFGAQSFFCKIIASVACFTFVFLWHGEEDYVFFWVLFNFIAVTLESCVQQLCQVDCIQRFLSDNISPENIRRLGCLLAAPLHYFSMVSNYFFIGAGVEVGQIYLNRFFYGTIRNKMIILFFLYGAGQAAVTIQARRKRLKMKKDSKRDAAPSDDFLHVM